MKTLYEGILSDMESTLEIGNEKADEVNAKKHILDLLHNPEWFTISNHVSDEDYFEIRKHRGMWTVDVKNKGHYIVCHCPEGYITDGSFRFGSVDTSFSIAPAVNKEICNCKSLKYGPTAVKDLQITNCPELKDLKDCPRTVYQDLYIDETGINTLKYLPVVAYNRVTIEGNKELKSLNKTKKITTKAVYFANNGFECTNDMIKQVWNVSGSIFADDSPYVKLPF
jgi:hypothetical protein